MSDSVLVTVEKDAKRLRIHVDALHQHIKLGWRQIESDGSEQDAEEAVRRERKPRNQNPAE